MNNKRLGGLITALIVVIIAGFLIFNNPSGSITGQIIDLEDFEFVNLPEDFAPTAGYYHGFGGGRIVLTDGTDLYISDDGSDFNLADPTDLPSIGLPEDLEITLGFYSDMDQGAIWVWDHHRLYLDLESDGGNNFKRVYHKFGLPRFFIPEIGYHHTLGNDGKGLIIVAGDGKWFKMLPATNELVEIDTSTFDDNNIPLEPDLAFFSEIDVDDVPGPTVVLWDRTDYYAWDTSTNAYFEGPKNVVVNGNKINPNVAYYDDMNNFIVLWDGTDAYASDDGQTYVQVRGEVIAGCLDDDDCDADEFCNSDDECEKYECMDDDDCASDEFCNDDNECEEQDTCSDDDDCASDEFCNEDDLCEEYECMDDDDCASDEFCNDDNECQEEGGVIGDECDVDDDCDADEYCANDGFCYVINVCNPSWDCTDWSDCSGGIKTRSCEDLNNCGDISDRPDLSVDCDDSGDAYCGDGTCNGDDSCSNCPGDCGSCDEQEDDGGLGITILIILGFLVLLVVLAIILYFSFKKKGSLDNMPASRRPRRPGGRPPRRLTRTPRPPMRRMPPVVGSQKPNI